MSERIKIEHVETLSQRWADLKRYTLLYRRRDGRLEQQVREVHDHGSGAAVLPYDRTRGTVLLVRQFRLPVFLAGGSGDLIEACAGLLDGNDPEICIRREAEEELGYRLDNLRKIASCFMTPGAVTERISMFLADYTPANRIGEGGGHADESEDIEVLEMSFNEAWRLMQTGEIADAKTLVLLLYLAREIGI
jgi:nudix-type nucleoside diphosphatase (YffH/AdpP family)